MTARLSSFPSKLSRVATAALILILGAACGTSAHRTSARASITSAGAPAPRSTPNRTVVGTVVRTVQSGGFLDGLAYAGGKLWAADLDGDRVVRIDPTTGRIIGSTTSSPGPLTLTAGDGAVWAANYKGHTVTRIDAATGRVTATVATPGRSPCGLVLSGRRLWVFDQSDGSAAVIDSMSAKVVATFSP